MKKCWFHSYPIAAAIGLIVVAGCTINAGLHKKTVALEEPGPAPERTPIYHSGDWIIARGSLHNHTIYSDGCRTPEDLLELARRQGMAILSYNDHREGRICAGDNQSFCVKVGGVEDAGYDVYYDHLRRIQAQAAGQDMIALKGVEYFPYFYNYGKFPALALDGFQYHFTVYGIEDTRVLAEAPVSHNVSVRPAPVPDETPWQDFVSYIDANGGIVHAVHVEDGANMWVGYAHGDCPGPVKNIHRLRDLTGFSALPSAWHERTGGPGGLWDTALAEYLLGMRDRPIWAMADADYHCDGSLAIATTLFYMREFTEDEVYRCLREGRMVALQGDAFQDSYVSRWWVSDGAEPAERVMLGREVKVNGAPTVRFALELCAGQNCASGASRDAIRTRLVRNGRVVHETAGGDFTYRDDEAGAAREPVFYRVEVIGPTADRGINDGPTMPESELFVNPIFVRFE